MSGKEAQVYLVIASGEERVAKIYKEAANRSFKHRAEYTEGRGVRNTRDQRAISKRSTHGRAQDEAAWRETEVHMISRLRSAGVRVPEVYNFVDGVVVMELIKDADGNPAPRLGDLDFTIENATAVYEVLIRDVVKMLCAGIVHGDLSDFNVLMAADGPVLIDFPQSVDSAHNPNARKLLLRDVDNLHDFLGRFVKNARRLPYAEEMWELYQSNGLTAETPLTGIYKPSQKQADTASVLALIDDANRDERRRRDGLGLRGGPAVSTSARPPIARPPGPRHGQQGQPRHAQQGQPRHATQGLPRHMPPGMQQRQAPSPLANPPAGGVVAAHPGAGRSRRRRRPRSRR